MISIIIPVYNVEQYLHQCIDSVIAQTYPNFELILVDDGSVDSSGMICDYYQGIDSRIRVFHIPNGGVSSARNKGIDESIGDWITFIDSDDFVSKDYLERFRLDYDNADLIIQGLEHFDDRDGHFFRPVRLKKEHLVEDRLKEQVAQNDLLRYGYPIAKAYKRILIGQKIRFNSGISFHEDHIFVLTIMNEARSIRLEDSVAYKYRCYHSFNSLSQKRHPWTELNESADEMLSRLAEMEGRFLEKNSLYGRDAYTFAYEPKISALFEMYRTVQERAQRKSNYHKIIDKELLRSTYYPKSIKNKIIKLITGLNFFLCIDVFLKITVWYQERH